MGIVDLRGPQISFPPIPNLMILPRNQRVRSQDSVQDFGGCRARFGELFVAFVGGISLLRINVLT